jgi:transposase-like protein
MEGLKRALRQRMLGADLTEHLGYGHGAEVPPAQANRRSGASRKTVRGDGGAFELEVPRDRDGSFEPGWCPRARHGSIGSTRVGRTRKRSGGSFSRRTVAMYARGMSVRDIRGHLEELYGLEVSPDLIGRVTDAVLDEVKEWRSRALDAVYPVVIFDALRVRIRDKGSRIVKREPRGRHRSEARGERRVSRARHHGRGPARGAGPLDRRRRGAKFWLGMMNELRNRGAADILIAAVGA